MKYPHFLVYLSVWVFVPDLLIKPRKMETWNSVLTLPISICKYVKTHEIHAEYIFFYLLVYLSFVTLSVTFWPSEIRYTHSSKNVFNALWATGFSTYLLDRLAFLLQFFSKKWTRRSLALKNCHVTVGVGRRFLWCSTALTCGIFCRHCIVITYLASREFPYISPKISQIVLKISRSRRTF